MRVCFLYSYSFHSIPADPQLFTSPSPLYSLPVPFLSLSSSFLRPSPLFNLPPSPSQDGLTALDLAKKQSMRFLISDTLAARTAAKNVRQRALNVHHVEHIVLQLSWKILSPPLSCILSQALSPLLSVSLNSPLTLICSLFLPPLTLPPSLSLSLSLPLSLSLHPSPGTRWRVRGILRGEGERIR
jgi:hypothetical protein